MNINFTFFLLLKINIFMDLRKNKKYYFSLTKLGFKNKYVNINDLSINGIIHLRRLLKTQIHHFIVRTIGIKSFILYFYYLLKKYNFRDTYKF